MWLSRKTFGVKTEPGLPMRPFSSGVRFSSRVRFWISGMGITAALHLALLAVGGASSGEVVVAVTGWLLVALLLARDAPLANEQGGCAGMSGLILLGIGLALTVRSAWFDLWFLKILPFLLLGGVLLLSCGWGGLISRWRLTAMMLVVAAPEKLLDVLNFGGPLIVAHTRIAGFLLHCFGFDPLIRGVLITLPTGSVEVQEACSGLILMLLLLKIALLVCIAFPIRLTLRLMICAAALLTGFTAGVIRIAILAAIVHKREWFESLHGPVGMSLFPLVGFLLFFPFLLPVEKPFVELLNQVRSKWRSAPRLTGSGAVVIFTVMTGLAVGVCLPKIAWMKSCGPTLRSETLTALGLSCLKAEPRIVPADLQASRFNSMQEAWRGEFENETGHWKVLACSMSGAMLSPEEMFQDPKIAGFLEGQLGTRMDRGSLKIPGLINGVAPAAAPIPGGQAGVIAVNADGDRFFFTPEYAVAQQATLFRWSTWRDFLLTGRPLKDCRYWLIVTVFGEKRI